MADTNHQDTVMNDLNVSSPKKSSNDAAMYNIDAIGAKLEKMSLAGENDTKTESPKLPAKLEKDAESETESNGVSITFHQKVSGRKETETTSDTGEKNKEEHKQTLMNQHHGRQDTEKDNSGIHMVADTSTAKKSPLMVDATVSQQDKTGNRLCEEEKVLSMELEARGPKYGVAVPRKHPQKSSCFDTGKQVPGQIPCDLNFGTMGVDEDDENDPPRKYRFPGKVPQEHEEQSSPLQANLFGSLGMNGFNDQEPDHPLQTLPSQFESQDPIGANPDMFAEICPSFQQYDSDEFRRLKDDLIRGAEHLEIKAEPGARQQGANKQLQTNYSPTGELMYPDTPDSVASRRSNQTESSLTNILPSLSGKLDSGDIRVMMQDLDCISMEPEDGERVISVTDLIEGRGSTTKQDGTSEKLSPMSEVSSASPGSVYTNSPYSDNPTPGSEGLSSPGEAIDGDDSSRDSFASSKRSSASQKTKKLTTDQLPKPDVSSLLMGETLRDPSGTTKTNQTTKATQEKSKKSSKSKSKSTGRPRGRPPKSSKPPDKTVSRPLATIAPKPILPQVVTSGTTTLIILPNPGTINNISSTNNGLLQPGSVANAPLAVTSTVVTGQPNCPTSPPQPNNSSRNSGSSENAVGKTTRPDTLITDMLPSEKDKKNLKKAKSIVAEIPHTKLTYQDSDGDTLLHFLSLSNRYEDLIDQLFDNSQSLLTTGIPQERFIYKALIERMHSEAILSNMINLRNKQNQTPLYLAVSTSKAELVHLLLEKGADPNICAHTRKFNGEASGFRMPLHIAASKGKSHVPVLKLLLECPHIEIDATNSERKTALHCAVESHCPPAVDSTETTELLLKHKARLLKGPNDQTPLHTVIEKNDYHLLKFLVELLPVAERKPILNIKDSIGNTCLHLCAVQTKKKDASGKYLPAVVSMMRYLLLVCDVDIGIVNQKNETAKKLVCKDNEQVMTVYKEAENRRRNKRSQEKMREMEAMRLDQLHHQMFVPGGPNPAQRQLNPAMPNMGPYSQVQHAGLQHYNGMTGTGPQPPASYLHGGIAQGRRTPTKAASNSTNGNCKLTQQPPSGPYNPYISNQFQPETSVNHFNMIKDRYPKRGQERALPDPVMPQGALPHRPTNFPSPYIRGNSFCSANSEIVPQQIPNQSSQSSVSNHGALRQMTPPMTNMSAKMGSDCVQGHNGYQLPVPGLPDDLQGPGYPYGDGLQDSTADGPKDNFDDLVQLLSDWKDNPTLEKGAYTQNLDEAAGNSLKDMPWNVPYTGNEMPYEKPVRSGSVYNNKVSQSGQLVTNETSQCIAQKVPVETTKNSFLEQLVNGDCSNPNEPSQKPLLEEFNNFPLNMVKQMFPDVKPAVSSTNDIKMVPNQPPVFGSCDSPVPQQTHQVTHSNKHISNTKLLSSSSAMIHPGHTHHSAQPKSESNNRPNGSFSQALEQTIPTFQSDRSLLLEGDTGVFSTDCKNSVVPLHHCQNFDMQQFESPTRPQKPDSVHNGQAGNPQYHMDQSSWMQSSLQTVQNM